MFPSACIRTLSSKFTYSKRRSELANCHVAASMDMRCGNEVRQRRVQVFPHPDACGFGHTHALSLSLLSLWLTGFQELLRGESHGSVLWMIGESGLGFSLPKSPRGNEHPSPCTCSLSKGPDSPTARPHDLFSSSEKKAWNSRIPLP